MINGGDVPYADPESLTEFAQECRCVEAECTAHGVNLHQEPRHEVHAPAGQVVIGEVAQHVVDGLSDYGC